LSRPANFWSRRREAVAAEEEAIVAEEELATREAIEADKTDEELLEELGLPDPDTMTKDDDFTVFMGKMVPDRLRRRALRTLWRSNPVLANLDELVDYGGDFTDAATVVENLQTTYQVGKGMLKHVVKMAEEAEAKRAKEAGELPEADLEEEELLAEVEDVPELEEEIEPAPEVIFAEVEHEEQFVPPRRMQFAFEDDMTFDHMKESA
jgi:hypothetical protein